MSPFENKTIIITGASEGIGAELARQLGNQNVRLVLAARNEARLNELAFKLRKSGTSVLIVPTDVGDAGQCDRLVQQTVEHFGGVDILVNNAGVAMTGALAPDTDPSAIEQLIRVNLIGSIWCTQAALPALRATRGQVVGMSSLAGRFGIPGLSVYCASKFGLSGFYDALRLELAGSGVDVTVIHPGVVRTGLPQNALGQTGNGSSILDRSDAMTVEECAALTIAAMGSRQREAVLSRKARLGLALKGWLPELVDRLVLRAALGPARNG